MIFSIILVLTALLTGNVFAEEIDIGLLQQSGNAQNQSFSLLGKTKIKEVLVSGSFKYAENKGDFVEEKAYLGGNYDPKISENLGLWFYDQAGYDRKRGIEYENYLGGGLKHYIVEKKGWKVSFSEGLLWHSIDNKNLARLSFRPKVKWIKDKVEFEGIAFYQPNITNYADYIVTTESSIRYALTDKIGLKIKLEEEYRSITDREKNDLMISLNLSWRR